MVHFSLEVFCSSRNTVTVWFDLDNYTIASLQIPKDNFETVKTGCTDDLVIHRWITWQPSKDSYRSSNCKYKQALLKLILIYCHATNLLFIEWFLELCVCHGLTPASKSAPHGHSASHPGWEAGDNQKSKNEKTCGLI